MEKTGLKFNNLLEVAKAGEAECKEYFKFMRWNNKPVCPYCNHSEKIYETKSGRLKCSSCRKLFSITVGTIFHDSKIPLAKWFLAIYMISSNRKGMSSHQLAKDIDVTQKTSWFMLQRIRFSMKTESFNAPLKDKVEVDETYMGGKEKNKHESKKTEGSQGRSTKTKTPIFGMLERDGELRVQKVDDTKKATIQPIIIENIVKGSKVFSDEWKAYKGLNNLFEHQIVNHSKKQFVLGEIHTNGVEGFWSIFKRGIYGVNHWISVKHLDNYLSEYEFRYNNRKLPESEKFNKTLKKTNCRLPYKTLIDKV